MARARPLSAAPRLRLPGVPGQACCWLRLERDEADFLLSPLLAEFGSFGLCERCWVARRTATFDPAALAPRAARADDLLAAFEALVAASGRPQAPAQRVRLAAAIRERVRVARGQAPLDAPPTLLRVAPSGAASTEPVLPRPGCARCLALAHAPPQPALGHAVGRAAGIVPEWAEVPARGDEPAYPHVVTSRVANVHLEPARPAWRGGSGKGDSAAGAVLSAVAESIERYAAEIVPAGRLLRARFHQLASAVDPGRLTGMDPDQARAQGLDPQGETGWVQARSIAEPDVLRWVPASAVYLASPSRLGASAVTVSCSNGLAAAGTLAEAVCRAQAEVLERHAFFRVWYGLASARRAEASGLVDAELRQAWHRCGLVLRACVLDRLDGVHVAAASCWPAHTSPERPAFALGLGDGGSDETAVAAAVRELAQVYRGLSWALGHAALREHLRRLLHDPRQLAEPYDHALLHAARGPAQVPAPFGEGPPRVALRAEVPLGEALFVELTPPDVARFCALHVARVIVPDAIGLHFGVHQLPRRALGFEGADNAELAAWLHPLS